MADLGFLKGWFQRLPGNGLRPRPLSMVYPLNKTHQAQRVPAQQVDSLSLLMNIKTYTRRYCVLKTFMIVYNRLEYAWK